MVLTHRIVDHRHAFAAGDLAHPRDHVLAVVADHVGAAVRARELGLGLAPDGADHRGAEVLGPLAGDRADAACGGVEQDGLAGLHAIGPPQQVLRGHALEHHRRGLLVADAVRERDQAICGHQPALGVGADRRRGVGHALPRPQVAHPLAHGLDHAGAFEPRRERQLRRRIQTAAEIHVDVVQSDRRLPNQRLTGPGRPDVGVLEAQDLRSANLVHAHDTRHLILPLAGFTLRTYSELDRPPSQDERVPPTIRRPSAAASAAALVSRQQGVVCRKPAGPARDAGRSGRRRPGSRRRAATPARLSRMRGRCRRVPVNPARADAPAPGGRPARRAPSSAADRSVPGRRRRSRDRRPRPCPPPDGRPPTRSRAAP